MSRGVLMFGINNEHIQYTQLAIMASAFVKRNMPGAKTAIITDAESRDFQKNNSAYQLDSFFDHVIIAPKEKGSSFSNQRKYSDTRYYHVSAQFKNTTRSLAYELSPFDETLLIDSDVLVANNALSAVWGCQEDVLINHRATNLFSQPLDGQEDRLNPYGIKMSWATIIYFKKSPKAELLFNLVEHIKENWQFYKLTYHFPGGLYRNDYAFSIALHILNSFEESFDFAKPLPDDTILTALDIDQFFKIISPTDFLFFVNDKRENWKFYACKTRGLNVHCMNKISLLNNMDQIMEALT